MAEGQRTFKWKALGASVCGASHARINLPNQDSIKFDVDQTGRPPVILAVSDGHGSPKCFRSDKGSIRAVQVAISTCFSFLERTMGVGLPALKSLAEKQLPKDIVKNWRDLVTLHYEQNPFLPAELDRLEKEAGLVARQSITSGNGYYLAYGATLLITAISEQFIIHLQLGDGDILTVSAATSSVESPMPRDEELIANETTSLCMDGAERKFRFRFQVIHENAPALILISTDGYSNSFSSEGDFRKVGSDLLQLFKTDGPDVIEENLQSWLADASQIGSGDDVTLGILYRLDVIKTAPDVGTMAATPPADSRSPMPIPNPLGTPSTATEIGANEADTR